MTWTATRTATRPTSPSSRSRTSGQSTRSNHHHQLHLPSASSPSAGRISNSPSPTRNGNLPFLHENVLLSSNASTRLGASTINLSAFIQSPISILLFNRLLTTENPIRTVAIRSRSLLGAGTAATWAYHTSSCDVTRERKGANHPTASRQPCQSLIAQPNAAPHALEVDVLATAIQVAALPLALVVAQASVQLPQLQNNTNNNKINK